MIKAVPVLLLLIGLGVPGEAKAYLDPGTGSAMLQMAIAGLLGGMFVLKTYWRKLVTFFSSKSTEDADASADSTPQSDNGGSSGPV